MDPAVWQGFIRHLLTMLGGVLVAKGWLDESVVPQVIGAIMTLFGVIWSYKDKKAVEAKVESALMMPPPKK